MKAAGTITIEFVATDASKNTLLEEFEDFFVKYGEIKLTNMNGQETELLINSHEFTFFDEESDYGDEEYSNGYEI